MRQTYVKLCYYYTSKWAEDQVKILNILLYVVLDQFWMLQRLLFTTKCELEALGTGFPFCLEG